MSPIGACQEDDLGLRYDPIGGGQFKAAVQQIIEAERAPIKQMETHKKTEESRLKLFQEFKNKFGGFEKTLAEFSNFKNFRELKVDLGDGDKNIEVTVDKATAEPGTYDIQIDQLAHRSSVLTNGFEKGDEANLGVGYVVFRQPDGETREIYIDEKQASLKGIARAINDEKNLSVQASVINDQSDPEQPWKLLLSSKGDGIQSAVEFPELYFMDGRKDIFYRDDSSAENALIKVNGMEVEAGTNDIKNFVNGVNVRLKQARPDSPFTIRITEDHKKMTGKVKELVDQVNGILQFINKQNQVDEKTDTKGGFTGDTGMQTIEFRIRNLMHESFPDRNPSENDDYKLITLSQLGIEFSKDGSLGFKEDHFQKTLEDNFNGVTEAVTGEFGVASQLRQVIASYTRTGDGFLNNREKGLRERIARIDKDIADKEARVQQKAEAVTQQFSRLQASLSNMQRQQQQLSATLGGGGGGNLVQQLLGG